MSWVTTFLRGIAALTGLGNATARLIEAAKESEPPPTPPIGNSGVDPFMRGVTVADARHELAERNQRATGDLFERVKQLDDEPAEEPQP